MKYSPQTIYCIDASALIIIQRYYPRRVFPDLWKQLEDLFKSGKLVSHDFVYDEIVSADKKAIKDDLAEMVSKYKGNFRPISKIQAQLVAHIVSMFPNLIDPNSKKDQADPWIVAMSLEAMQEPSLFGEDTLVVVSTESEKSSTKIPAVCKQFKVKHMNLFEFFDDNGWQFTVSKR